MKPVPVQVMGQCDMAGNAVACNAVLYTVPAGKRLVIEYASMEAALPVGQTARMGIQILIGGSHFTHTLPMTAPTQPGFFTGAHYTSVAQKVRIYVDEGQTVRAWVQRSDGSNGSGSAKFAISGYQRDK
jgi:hypothetical protein